MEIPAATRTDLGGPFGILLAMAASCLLFRHFAAKKRFAGLPPGPPPLPFFGNMLQVDVKELIPSLREQDLRAPVHRPPGLPALRGPLGLPGAEGGPDRQSRGVQWPGGLSCCPDVEQRKRHRVRDRGALEAAAQVCHRDPEEFRDGEAVHGAADQGGGPVPGVRVPQNPSCAGSNIICSLVFGERFEYTDEAFLTLLDLINSNWKLMSSTWGQLLFVFPNVMRCLPGPHQRIYANYLKLAKFVGQRLERNRQTLDPNCPRDFIDCFLIKIQQEKGNASSHFTEETMSKTTVNLFFAGTETVSSTLRYGLLILLRHPEVEEKLHEEIDQVIGGNRAPCMDDRSQMPYTDAVIHEIQRYADIVPMGVPHTVTRDIEFRGYRLPKGLNVIPLLCTSQFDPTQFKNPQAFDPTHFLDESGGFRRREAFMAFSAGKRVCLGEGLANMELFLFLTTILQNFRLKALTDPSAIDISPESTGLGSIPRPYQLCLLPQ
ncbi:PREDICTED: cytochrome P450 2C31-like isoform X1 [Thamnophis sirtalis]|uniref:Cytochrome P450 2C31-like isoform X1 n=1 Tax=Thamnophis sirtalis TaxID=35019 RepID=A0A6I9XC98_9SAUR|nr:PREDICTED: cytochrome P450 2C31-like isoform X1 [Thamnophis sirtalis]